MKFNGYDDGGPTLARAEARAAEAAAAAEFPARVGDADTLFVLTKKVDELRNLVQDLIARQQNHEEQMHKVEAILIEAGVYAAYDNATSVAGVE